MQKRDGSPLVFTNIFLEVALENQTIELNDNLLFKKYKTFNFPGRCTVISQYRNEQ